MENARAFSMRLNDDEMRILRALYKNSGATGGLPAFVKQRVLDSKTVTASLKSILEMEVALEKGLGCIKKTTDLIRAYDDKIESLYTLFKMQLEKVRKLKP